MLQKIAFKSRRKPLGGRALKLRHVLFCELCARHVPEVIEGHLQRAVPHGKGQLFDVSCGFKKVERSGVTEAVKGLLLGDMFRVRLELGP